MTAKNKHQIENIVGLILLVLLVSSGVFLALVLFVSPSL